MRTALAVLLLALPLAACSSSANAGPVAAVVNAKALAPTDETLLLQQPTISKDNVVFAYARDLWVVSRAGGTARRLTSSPGVESGPRLSPDGRWVAFSGQYEGNVDVYVISIDGGMPTRLTWHPGGDRVLDWHPDGERILFASGRDSSTPVDRLVLVKVTVGPEEALPVPRVSHAQFNADASRIAYTAISDAFRTWKRYRGGTMCPIWILDPNTLDVEEIPHERASDTFPTWVGGDVYFASDRDKQMNIWRYTPGSKSVEQITKFTDYDVRNMDSDGTTLAFEQGGRIHLYDPATKTDTALSITVPSDGLHSLPRWQDVRGSVRGSAIAPNGKRAVIEARGEIVSVPKENGDTRNLTNSPGVHDRDPSWSPDGKSIAWFSDASGEYQLMVQDQLAREPAKAFSIESGAGFYRRPTWSPDGKSIAFLDKGGRLAYLTVETGAITEIRKMSGSLGEVGSNYTWSPDSKWIAFEEPNPHTLYSHISLFEVETGKVTVLTDAFGDCGSPAFSRDNKHLFFTATVESGPNQFGLDMSAGAFRTGENGMYVAVLQKDGKNPLFPKSDEGVPSDDDKKGKGGKDGKGDEKKDGEKKEGDGAASQPDAKGDKKKDLPKIDLDGLDQRILALPLPQSRYFGLASTKDKLLFLEAGGRRGGGGGGGGGGTELKKFDFDEKKAETLLSGVGGFEVSADGDSLLVQQGGQWKITNASGKDDKTLAIDSVRVRVDPTVEWPQTLREVWRIERDYFYDPNMHGVDWPKMWDRWSKFLPHVRHRDDLNLVIGEMIGELCCGHEYVSGGESPDPPQGVSVGLLGCDVKVAQNRFQLTKLYRGQNWNPGLRAPLLEPGVDARVGDFVIRVEGRELTADQNFFRAFENTAGRQIEIELSQNADGSDSRKVKVVPIGSDFQLRRLAWVEECRKRVDDLSGGRLAYLYMPNTADAGEAAFDRDFYSQLDKEGVIVDERFNGGGKVADYVIDVLSRTTRARWMNREAWVGRTPFAMIAGPKVMIINERAGSGGDCMPWMFQNAKVGTLVGTRTWGGLVGISGYPPLMDGGSVTAASFGVMDPNGEWAVENEGVTPDITVVEYPKDIMAGKDPQLEKAVEVAMKELAGKTQKAPPTYPPPKVR